MPPLLRRQLRRQLRRRVRRQLRRQLRPRDRSAPVCSSLSGPAEGRGELLGGDRRGRSGAPVVSVARRPRLDPERAAAGGVERGSGVDSSGHGDPHPGGQLDSPLRSGTAGASGRPGVRGLRRGGPASSARTAVVWEVLSAVLAEAQADGHALPADEPSDLPSDLPQPGSAGGVPAGRRLEVVDAGGGSGGFAVPLAEAGHRVVVVDPSPDSLAALSRRADEAGVGDRVRAVQGDLADLPGALGDLAGAVDLVLCHSVLEVVDDPAAALAALAGVLRPGGRLSLLAPNRAAAVLARALAGRPDEAAHVLSDPAGRWGPGDGTARRWDATALGELVTASGLVVEQVHGVRVVADLVPSAVLELEPGAGAALLALERALSDRSPFRDLATLLHVLAVRPVG